jgi:rod shape determining protein RodA
VELTLPGGATSTYRPRSRIWRNIPWPLLLLALSIAALGVWNLASTSRVFDPDSQTAFGALHRALATRETPAWKSQIYWLLVGLAACGTAMLFDYRWLLRLAYPMYGLVILLLLAVLFRGHAAMGARRWLDFGPIHLQPSELMKIAIVLVLARFFHEDPRQDPRGYSLFHLWLPALLILVPLALVMKQPDLGTAMMIAAIASSVTLFAKLRWKTMLVLAGGTLVSAALAWSYLLKDYQKRRVASFLDPEGDMLGAGYHASQSLIAVGSGQGWGKGWGQGTQTRFSFLPEQHTDFIFSVWGEEHGFVGALLLLGLYLVLLLLVLGIAAQAREKFGAFLALGLGAMFFWHVFINIGMVTGLLPVVGVTLPLMSYGGSSVLTNMLGLGLLMNVGMRRHLF